MEAVAEQELTIITAEYEHIPELITLAEIFSKETGYNVVFSPVQAFETFKIHIDHPVLDCIIALSEGNVVGAILLATDKSFQEQPFCYVEKFYTDPEFRGRGMGRELMTHVVGWANSHNCSHIFATATAGTGEQKTKIMENLMTKFGFESCGPTMCKEMK